MSKVFRNLLSILLLSSIVYFGQASPFKRQKRSDANDVAAYNDPSEEQEETYAYMPVWNVSSPLPYAFLPAANFNSTEKSQFQKAMAAWAAGTCIRYVEVPYSDKLRSTIIFNRTSDELVGGWCQSQNKTTGTQEILMRKIVFDRNDIGSIIHELGHSLGLQHEHQRPDRELDVYPEFVYNEKKDQIAPTIWGIVDGAPYDVMSIMHYSGDAMEKKDINETAMKTWDPDQQFVIGSRELPSFNDFKRINLHYRCPKMKCGSQQLSRTCLNGGYQDPSNCSSCKCPPGISGQYCDQLQTAKGFGNSTCGGLVELSLCEAKTIMLPTYPNNYPIGAQCTWLIKSSGCNLIFAFEEQPAMTRLRFNATSRCLDWVEIRTNFSRLDKPGKFFCTASQVKGRKILIDGSFALVHFNSISNRPSPETRGSGFKLTVKGSCMTGTTLPYTNTTCKIAKSAYDASSLKAVYCDGTSKDPAVITNIPRQNVILLPDSSSWPVCVPASIRTTSANTVRVTSRTTTSWSSKTLEKGWTPLHEAAYFGDLDTVKDLISQGASLTAKSNASDEGRMPIHESAMMGELAVVQYMLSLKPELATTAKNDRGNLPVHEAVASGRTTVVDYFLTQLKMTNENQRDTNGWTLLHRAAAYGQLGMVKFLLRRGANITTKAGNQTNGESPLHSAAGAGQFFVVQYMVEVLNRSLVDTKNNDGERPIHSAAAGGKLNIVEYLLSQPGASMNVKGDISGRTPLHSASSNGKIDVVRYLVSKGADVKAKTVLNGRTAVQLAAYFGQLQIVKFFLEETNKTDFLTAEDGNGDQMIHIATLNNKTQIIEYLVSEQKADVNAKSTKNGKTPLHRSTDWGSIDAARLLVSKGADARVKSFSNLTAIQFAVDFNQLGMIKFFLEEVDDTLVNITTDFGDQLLHYAVRRNKADIIRYLLTERQVGVDTRNPKLGRTPLHTTAEIGDIVTADFLILNGADAFANTYDSDFAMLPIHLAAGFGKLSYVRYMVENVSDTLATAFSGMQPGWQPLHRAAFNGRFDIVDYLTKIRGISIDVPTNATGRSALHSVASWGDLANVKLLVERGANLTARDSSRFGSMPIHLSAEFGYLAVVQYLVGRDANQLTVKNLYGETPEKRAEVGKKLDVKNWLHSQPVSG